jgi:DNA-binding transcriptional LysR family regulator
MTEPLCRLVTRHGAWAESYKAYSVVDKRSLLLLYNGSLSEGTCCSTLGSVTLDLRQLRSFVAVAERGSFTRAADDLYVAQQAVSQQIKALENSLGVTLLLRNSRRVELTPAGQVFLAESRRVLSAADRAVQRVREAAMGEVGTVRIVYTLTAAHDTVPVLLSRLHERFPQLKAEIREVFADDIPRLLQAGRCDVGIGPATEYPGDLRQQLIRWESWRLAVGEKHALAGRARIALRDVSAEQVELWPRDMTPGYYDAVVKACRAAGFEPRLDKEGSGSTVWGYIAQGRGIGLVVASLAAQPPSGVKLIEIAAPEPPPLGVTAIWLSDNTHKAVDRLLEIASQLAAERGWI